MWPDQERAVAWSSLTSDIGKILVPLQSRFNRLQRATKYTKDQGIFGYQGGKRN